MLGSGAHSGNCAECTLPRFAGMSDTLPLLLALALVLGLSHDQVTDLVLLVPVVAPILRRLVRRLRE